MANTISIKVYSDNQEELVAAGTITPGMICERTSSNTVQAQSTTSVDCEKMFAIEDDYQGNSITDNYSSGDRVYLVHAYPGDIINAVLTTGSNIAIGDFLECAGDGTLKEYSAGIKIAVAVEAINPSVANTQYAVKIL